MPGLARDQAFSSASWPTKLMMRPADKYHLQLYQLHAGKMVNILGVKKSNLLILHEGCLLSFVGHAWDTGESLVSKPGRVHSWGTELAIIIIYLLFICDYLTCPYWYVVGFQPLYQSLTPRL